MAKQSPPLVSIITPMYNSANYIADTINSVLIQDYQNWQLILVDDGSTDNTREIVKEFAAKHPCKIIFTGHKNFINKGVTATRNLAISLATGELAALLDSDDLWLPGYLSEQVEFLMKNPEVETLCQASIYWKTWAEPNEKDELILVGAPPEKTYYPPQLAVTLYPLGEGAAPCMDGIIMRMEALKKIGGFEESFRGKDQLYEDQAFAIKNYLHNIVHISSNAKNLYRQRPQSLMHGLIDEGLYDQGRFFFLQWLKDYLKQNNIRDKAVHRLLYKSLLPFQYPVLYKLSSGIKRRYKSLIKRSFAA